MLLVASLITPVFQLFPGAWTWVLGIVDVRSWTWRSYAVASTLWIVVFTPSRLGAIASEHDEASAAPFRSPARNVTRGDYSGHLANPRRG
jgi:hypothetical protein